MTRSERSLTLLSLGAFLVASGAAQAQPGHAWKTYGNGRYGYSLCYPAELFKPGSEPPAGDGVEFMGPAQTTLIATGGHDIPDLPDSPLSAKAEEEAKAVAGKGAKITYRASRASWAVVSGTTGGRVFYVREIKARGIVAGFQLVYPKAGAALYTPIIARMNGCLNVAPQ